jgi:hypothetical protein
MSRTSALFFVALFLLCSCLAPCLACAQESAPHQEKLDKKQKKALRAAQKEEAERVAWEEATRPPGPAYPSSLRPEFVVATRQATLLMDNAFNSISKSRVEFALANQASIQAVSVLLGAVQNEGERQVALLLYDYSQRIPICQQMAWDSMQNVVTLLANARGVRGCMYEARRVRAMADRTFLQNNASSR